MDNLLEFLLEKKIIHALIIVIVAILVYNIIKYIVKKTMRKGSNEFHTKRRKTVTNLVINILKWAMIALTVTIILDLYGVNINSIIASLGIASAVSALAFQDTLKDIISGSAIIMDNYFMVGDYVEYNGFQGEIIELTMRTTKIKDFDGQVMVIANRNISEITNLSQQTASALIVVPTAYEEKIEKVEKILGEIVEEVKTWEDIDKEYTKYIGIVEFKDSSIQYGIRIYSTLNRVWEYKRATLKLIKQKYDKNKIKIPYNQIEVHNAK